jgi:adenylate kinase
MRILMVAPPGSGKGTQAARLAEHYGITHLASGDLLRREMRAGTDIGTAARAYVDRGDLVPDELVMRLVIDRILAVAPEGGFVLDGFPRNLEQAEEAHAAAEGHEEVQLQAVVHLDVPRDELRRRMLARADAEGRSDDSSTVIEHRLAVYDAETEPLLDYYRRRGILISVDGTAAVDEVTASLFEALDAVDGRHARR